MLVGTGGGYDPGRASHAALLELRQALVQHPAIRRARGEPPDRFTRILADVDPRAFGSDATDGTLTVRWYAGDTPEASPEFAFHYSDDSGLDCGWHHEPNPHVEGWGHFQRRESAGDAYEYEPASFGSENPVRVCWTVLDRLARRLSKECGR